MRNMMKITGWMAWVLLAGMGLNGWGEARAQETAPAVAVPQKPTQDREQEATFDVFEYRVEGSTLLSTTLVEQAVYPHLGEKKSLADVEQAREALEKA